MQIAQQRGEIRRRLRVDDIIDQKILDRREIYLWGSIDDRTAERIVRRLIYLDALAHEDIKLYVNSPGGVITSGLAIIDSINLLKSDVSTICIGQAASMGAVILALGRRGKRLISPNARVMIHQPLIAGQIFGPASDIQIQADEILRVRKKLNDLFVQATGKDLKTIEQDSDRDFFMEADEAVAYGIVDGILSSQ